MSGKEAREQSELDNSHYIKVINFVMMMVMVMMMMTAVVMVVSKSLNAINKENFIL